MLEKIVMVATFILLGFVTVSNIMQARVNVNELAAINALRQIYTDCENYRANQNPPAYPKDLKVLVRAERPYIDESLAIASTGVNARQGYTFIYAFVNPDKYICSAKPFKPKVTGRRVFFMDQSGVIRMDNITGHPVE